MNAKVATAIKNLANDNPQNRQDDYPRSNVPDFIGVYGDDPFTVRFEFKNTTERTAESYARNRISQIQGAKIVKVSTYQSGNYPDDWVTSEVEVK